jgi:hypothetical protein
MNSFVDCFKHATTQTHLLPLPLCKAIATTLGLGEIGKLVPVYGIFCLLSRNAAT